MKHSTEQLAIGIVDHVLSSCSIKLSPVQKVLVTDQVQHMITWHIDDALKLIKNINTTSISQLDRFRRLLELEDNFGIPKTYTI